MLAQAVDYDRTSAEGKLLAGIMDMLGHMAEAIEVEFVSADTGGVDMFLYDCPGCGAVIEINEETIERERHIICPKCNDPIIIATHGA